MNTISICIEIENIAGLNPLVELDINKVRDKSNYFFGYNVSSG
ncbi:MAG TPA: hypothetical protein VER35_00855 [Candidatus Limnocylindrales bacterium]|nr:hypothetical protein [Candidatus Limnocylindrales bacterium]